VVHRWPTAGSTAAIAATSDGGWGEAAALGSGGRLLATAVHDGPETGTVRVWDTAAGTQCAAIAAADPWAEPDDQYEKRIPDVAFSPDGVFLATTAMMGRAFVWQAATGAPHATLAGHDRGWPVVSVKFSPDGALLATGSLDWTARIWDAATGVLHSTLTCDEAVYTVAFSPEGTLLGTVCHDRTIWVWDLARAAPQTIIRSTDFVNSVAFLPGGRYLATAADTGTARIWDIGAGPAVETPAVTLVALTGDGYATLLPDGGYKLSGETGDRLWWLAGLHRFTPGELATFEGGPQRLAPDARILPDI
jgi:WD40 repeat protein